MPNYVRRQITHVNGLFSLHKWNALHAQKIEAMVVQDPEWILQIITFTKNLKALCENGQFEQIKTAFLTYFYLCPKSFNFHIDNAHSLEAMIAIVPEQAAKLRGYFQFYQLLFVKGFSLPVEARNATYRDAKTLAELTQAIDLNFRKGTLDKNLAKPLNDVVINLLLTTEKDTDQYEALSQLKSVLEANLSFNIAAVLAEKVSKDLRSNPKVEQPSEQTHDSFSPAPGHTNSE
jgi:hypothetical protein